MVKLTGRQKSELTTLSRKPGIWAGVEPSKADDDLAFYLINGLVRYVGAGKGYEITPAGRAALTEGKDE